jgi:hypothetical protein
MYHEGAWGAAHGKTPSGGRVIANNPFSYRVDFDCFFPA